MKKVWSDFQHTLAAEIGVELSRKFVASLFRQSHGDIKIAGKKYFDIGVSWAPVIIHWKNWIVKQGSPMRLSITAFLHTTR